MHNTCDYFVLYFWAKRAPLSIWCSCPHPRGEVSVHRAQPPCRLGGFWLQVRDLSGSYLEPCFLDREGVGRLCSHPADAKLCCYTCFAPDRLLLACLTGEGCFNLGPGACPWFPWEPGPGAVTGQACVLHRVFPPGMGSGLPFPPVFRLASSPED